MPHLHVDPYICPDCAVDTVRGIPMGPLQSDVRGCPNGHGIYVQKVISGYCLCPVCGAAPVFYSNNIAVCPNGHGPASGEWSWISAKSENENNEKQYSNGQIKRDEQGNEYYENGSLKRDKYGNNYPEDRPLSELFQELQDYIDGFK